MRLLLLALAFLALPVDAQNFNINRGNIATNRMQARTTGAQPSFVLNFRDLGAGVVDTTVERGGVAATFTRVGTALTVDSTGFLLSVASGSPRSYYDPTTLAYLGYLAEGQRTNLVLQSSNLGTTWAAVGTPTRAAGSFGLGAITLDLIGDDDPAALEGYTQTITYTADVQKTVSVFVAKSTSTSAVVRLRDTTAGADRLLGVVTWSGDNVVVTMTTGTQNGTAQRFTSTGVPYAYRIDFLTTAVTAANTNSLQIYPATDAALSVGATGAVYAGGFQSENALFASMLKPTTVATVTQNSDLLTYPLTGWFNAATGTLFASATRLGTVGGSNSGVYSINDGSTNNRLDLRAETSLASNAIVSSGGVQQAGITGTTYAQGVQTKSATAYAVNDFSRAQAGTLLTPDTVGSVPVAPNIMLVGDIDTGGIQLFGAVANEKYFRPRLPDGLLINMSR